MIMVMPNTHGCASATPCWTPIPSVVRLQFGAINPQDLKQFDENFAAPLKDPKTDDLFRVPLYMAAGESDIALNNGQKDLALFNQYGVRHFWVLKQLIGYFPLMSHRRS